MKFGPVEVGDAVGAILAHSMGIEGGRIRKGRVITAEDVALLRAAGHDEVTVARLEAGDVGEDLAADAVASAMVPDPTAVGLRFGKASTGRVNVYAEGPGVLELDVEAIEAANRIDPMITVATLPNFARTRKRGIVSTVKIISYGVAEASVEAVIAVVGDGMQVHPVQLNTATLIQTTIGDGNVLKGEDAVEGRLTALGMVMSENVTVPHRTADLAKAIDNAKGDVVLILTASATSDVADVAPEAVRGAGGIVTRFGLPVDPGNLLFLGEVAGRPVIGLPGCVRSPALNGADWVLERVVCGLPVTNADMAAMGVGGLLKDSPARGMPRE